MVADVVHYPEFVPGCDDVRVAEQSPTEALATVMVSGKGISESFVTANSYQPDAIHMRLVEGPFKTLEGRWAFTAIGDRGCKVEIAIDYSARGLLAPLLVKMADVIANRLVDAFVERMYAQAAED